MTIVYQATDTTEPWADTDAEMLGNMGLYNVRDGCAVTYSGANMNATVASGNVTHNGSTVAVAGGSVTLVADGTNPRWTWIYVDSTGTPGITSGTAASDPSKPELGDYVALACVKVEAGQTIANNIANKLDKRIMAGWVTSANSGYVRKSADESVTSSATLQNDDELLLAIAANETRIFDLHVAYVGGTTGDFRFGFTFPSGCNLYLSATSYDTTTTQQSSVSSGASGTASALGATTAVLFHARGVVMNGATAGNFQFQWAQSVSNGTATTVKAGSTLRFL